MRTVARGLAPLALAALATSLMAGCSSAPEKDPALNVAKPADAQRPMSGPSAGGGGAPAAAPKPQDATP